MSGDRKSARRHQPPRNSSTSMAEGTISHDEPASRQSNESFKDFVSRTLTSMSTKMDTILTGQAALEQRFTQIEARIDSNKNEINEVAKSLEFESAITKDNSSDIKAMRKHIQEQDKALELATDMIQTMDAELNSLQRYTRGFNVRIIGMAEQEGEDCINKVEAILENNFDIKAADVHPIENAHRVGQSVNGRPRQMIARFHSRALRRSVMAAAKQKLAETPYRFVDDLMAKDLEAKKRVLPFMEKLYKDNMKPRFANGRLYAKGKLVPQERITAFLSQR